MNLAPCRIELPPSRRSNLGPSAFLGQPRVLLKRIEALDGVLIMLRPATDPNFDQFMGCFPKWASKPSFKCGQNVQILISMALFVGHFKGRPIENPYIYPHSVPSPWDQQSRTWEGGAKRLRLRPGFLVLLSAWRSASTFDGVMAVSLSFTPSPAGFSAGERGDDYMRLVVLCSAM